MPLNTRPGVAQPPIEPGERCLRCDAVRRRQAVEAVPLHDTGEALALAGADDVDGLRRRSNELGGELLAERVRRRVVGAELDEVAARRHAGLGEVAGLRLVDLARVDRAEAELDGGVAVARRRCGPG